MRRRSPMLSCLLTTPGCRILASALRLGLLLLRGPRWLLMMLRTLISYRYTLESDVEAGWLRDSGQYAGQ